MPVQENEKKTIPEEKIDNAEKINPEYYRSLPKSDRAVNAEPAAAAASLMTMLSNSGIKFSAVKRENNVTAITVAKKDLPEYETFKRHVKLLHVQDYKLFSQKQNSVKTENEKPAFFSRKGLKKEASDVNKNKYEVSKDKGKDHSL